MQVQHAHSFKMSYRWRTLDNPEIPGYRPDKTERTFLLKYYPKYYIGIDLKDIDRPTVVKIKVSILRDFVFKGPSEVKRWYGQGLRQMLPYKGVDTIYIPGFFLRDPFKHEKWSNSEKDVMRILRYLAHARSLKRINLSINQREEWLLANKINGSKGLVQKLNKVEVYFHEFKKFEIPGLTLKDSFISQSITHFGVFRCPCENMPELVKVLEILKNLKSLNIPRFLSHENMLKVIEGLSRLEHLNISVEDDILASMVSLVLPKSLKHLELAFVSSKRSWNIRVETRGLQDIPLLPGFSSIIQQLPLLDMLHLNFNQLYHEKSVNILNFLASFLAGIPRLSTLKFQIPSKFGEKLDFSPIFDGIQHLMPILKELEIIFPEDGGLVVFYPSPGYHFPNLSKMIIIGNIGAEFNIKKVSLMLTNKQISPILDIGYTISIETFQSFLRGLRKIGKLGLNIEIYIGGLLIRVAPQIVLEALVNFIKSMGPMKGLSLDIQVEKSKSWLEELSRAIKENPIIDDLKVSYDNFTDDDFCFRWLKGVLIEKSEKVVECTAV